MVRMRASSRQRVPLLDSAIAGTEATDTLSRLSHISPGIPLGPRAGAWPPLSATEEAAVASPLDVAASAYRSSLVPLRIVAALACASNLICTAAAVSGGGGVRARWAGVAAAVLFFLSLFLLRSLMQVVAALSSLAAPGFIKQRAQKTDSNGGDSGIVIHALYYERLGNNVLQYVFARARASVSRVAFSAAPLAPPFEHTALTAPAPMRSHGIAAALRAHAEFRAGMRAWLAAPAGGYIVDTRRLLGRQAAAAFWLTPGLTPRVAAAAADCAWSCTDVAVHLRLGDILWGHHAAYRPLPLSFYAAALRAVERRRAARVRRVVFVCEDPSDEIAQRLAAAVDGWLRIGGGPPPVVELRGASAAEDFAVLASAPNLVLSVSSFAWAAAWLGVADVVVVPDWGLLRAHIWAPMGALSVPALHDLALRRDDEWAPAAVADLLATARVPAAAVSDDDVRAATAEAVAYAAVFGLEPAAGAGASAGSGEGADAVSDAGADADDSDAEDCDARAGDFTAADAAVADRIYCALRERLPSLSDAALRESSRVERVPLRNLPRWQGHFLHTQEALFDC